MAVATFVQKVEAGSGANYVNSFTTTITPASGGFLFLTIGDTGGYNTVTVTDNRSNVWNKVSDVVTAEGKHLSTWYAQNVASGATIITATPGGYIAFTSEVCEWSGVPANPIDLVSFVLDSGYVQSHSVTTPGNTAQADELAIVSYVGGATATTFTLGSGFSNLASNNGSGTFITSAMASKALSAVGTVSGLMTTSEYDKGVIAIATFKVGVAGPPPAPGQVKKLGIHPGNGTMSLKWEATAGATGYNVKRATALAGPYVTVASQAGTTFVDSPLLNGQMYYYKITATNTGGEGPESLRAYAAPQVQLGNSELHSSIAMWFFTYRREDGAIVRPDPQGNNDAPNYAASSDIVSEGNAYALDFAVQSGRKSDFDDVETFNYTVLERRNDPALTGGLSLMRWHWNNVTTTPYDPNSAHDADMDRMRSLYYADAKWGSASTINYRARAVAIADDLASLMQQDVNGKWHLPADLGQTLTRPMELNPSYFDPLAYVIGIEIASTQAYRDRWAGALDGDYDIYARANAYIFPSQATTANIPPNWIGYRPETDALTLDPNNRANANWYAYEAFRRAYRERRMWDVMGDVRAKTSLGSLKAFYTTEWANRGAIKADYLHTGAVRGDYSSGIFDMAAYLVLTMDDPNNATGAAIYTNRLAPVYYSAGGYYGETVGVTSISYYSLSWQIYGEMSRQGAYQHMEPVSLRSKAAKVMTAEGYKRTPAKVWNSTTGTWQYAGAKGKSSSAWIESS